MSGIWEPANSQFYLGPKFVPKELIVLGALGLQLSYQASFAAKMAWSYKIGDVRWSKLWGSYYTCL